METGTNTLQRSYQIYNFTLSIHTTWQNRLKTAHFEAKNHKYVITQQQEWVYELSELYFLQVSTYCLEIPLAVFDQKNHLYSQRLLLKILCSKPNTFSFKLE